MVSEEKLKRLNPKEDLVRKSIGDFGKTYDCREAGYILEDGSMLDLSGKKEGGTPKTRSYDHREVNRILETGSEGISGFDAMNFFQKQTGAIRFGLYGTWDRGHDMIVQLNPSQTVSEKQVRRMKDCCGMFKADVGYDIFDDDGNRVKSEYKEKPVCNEAIKELLLDLKMAKGKAKSHSRSK